MSEFKGKKKKDAIERATQKLHKVNRLTAKKIKTPRAAVSHGKV